MISMMEIGATPAEKAGIPDSLVRQMHDLLARNMRAVVPDSPPPRPDDYANWKTEVFLGEVQASTRHLLAVDAVGLRGFLSFTAPSDVTDAIFVNEVQVGADHQGDGSTLRCLIRGFCELLAPLPHDTIRTYSNKANTRVHRLAERAGFMLSGRTERGCQYRIPKEQLLARFTRGLRSTASPAQGRYLPHRVRPQDRP